MSDDDLGYNYGYEVGYRTGHDLGYTEGLRGSEEESDLDMTLRIEALARACGIAETAVREGSLSASDSPLIVRDAEKFYAFLTGRNAKTGENGGGS